MEDFATLMLLGIRVREVRDLGKDAIWLPTHSLLIFDSAMSHEDRDITCRQILAKIEPSTSVS